METKDIIIPFEIANRAELTEVDQKLVRLAIEATDRSYAPYSRFLVGAALLLSNGEIVTGSNQENAAFPSGTCAERTTAFYAHSTFPDARFVTLAIAARGTDGELLEEPISPCGACRQALVEYEKLGGGSVRVLLVGRDKIFIVPSVHALLPFTFDSL